MAIKYWLGGIVGIGAAGLVGANLYADQQLKDFYQPKEANSKFFQVTTNSLNLGAFSGEADYTLSIIPDPCNPKDKLDLHIQDKISRQLNGYKIESTLVLPTELEKSLQPYFADQAPVAASSHVSWLGNIDVKITSPAINYKKDNEYLQSKGAVLEFATQRKDLKMLKDVHFVMPSFVARNDKSYLALDQLELKADQMHYSKILPKSSSTLTLNQFKLNTYDKVPIDINMQQFNLASESKISDKQFSIHNEFRIAKFKLPNSDDAGRVDLNFDVKNLDAEKLQVLLDELDNYGEQCNATAQSEEKMQHAVLALLEQGFKFESKDNAIVLGDTRLNAHLDGALTQAKYQDMDALAKNIANNVQLSGQMDSSKAFVRETLKMIPVLASQADNERVVDELLRGFQMQGFLKVEGDKLSSKFEYKAGKPRFIN